MWIVIKFDKKKINLLEYDLNNKIGGNTKIYSPRFSLEKFINFKKKINKFTYLEIIVLLLMKNFLKQITWIK